MSRFFIVLLGLVALSILARFSINTHTPLIEDDLAMRTQKALLEKNMNFAQVGIDGRDIYLSGIAPDDTQIDQAVEVAKAVFGVRSVVNQLELSQASTESVSQSLESESTHESTSERLEPKIVIPESVSLGPYVVEESQPLNTQPAVSFPMAESPYRTGFSYENGKLALSGVVADETSHLWLLNKAKDIYGKDNIDDQLRISYGAPQGWHNTVEVVLTNLVMFSKAEASIVDNVLTLSGPAVPEKLLASVVTNVNDGIGLSYIAKFELDDKRPLTDDVLVNETNADKTTLAECQRKFDESLKEKRILFDTNKSLIKRRSHVLLEQLVVIVKECSQFKIEVGGHTDSRGKRAYNQRLSEERAKAVVAYFKKKGATSELLDAKGYGELKPVADNNTVKGMARNRRIELKVGGK